MACDRVTPLAHTTVIAQLITHYVAVREVQLSQSWPTETPTLFEGIHMHILKETPIQPIGSSTEQVCPCRRMNSNEKIKAASVNLYDSHQGYSQAIIADTTRPGEHAAHAALTVA